MVSSCRERSYLRARRSSLTWVPRFLSANSWISGRDSFKWGRVVTSLVLVWPRLASHLCIMFKFHLNSKWGFFKPSELISRNDPDKNCSKKVQENVHVALWKYWTEIKIKPIFSGAHKYLFWAFGINAVIICIGYIYVIYFIYVQKFWILVRGFGIIP